MLRQSILIKVLVLWAAGLGTAAQFAKFSVIFPSIQAIYPDAGAELGFTVSIISLVGLIFGLVAALAIAQLGARRLMIYALILGAGLSFFQMTLPELSIMIASRVLEGLSHLIIVVAAPTLMAEVTKPNQRAAALTLWSTFFGVAFASVAWLGIPLVNAHGVEMLFLVHGVYMLVMAGLIVMIIPGARPHRSKTDPPSLAMVLRRHLDIYSSPYLSAPAYGWLFYAFSYVGLITVIPGVLPPETRAFTVVAMPLAGIVSSLTIGIFLIRRFGAIPVCITGFLLAILVLLVCLMHAVTPLLCILIFVAIGLVQSASFAAVPELNDTTEARAYANGGLAQMGNLGNASGTPVLLFILAVADDTALILTIVFGYSAGIALHLWAAWRRGSNPRECNSTP
ncbi:MAG: MFS transporter [Pseudomonadota bacterium]